MAPMSGENMARAVRKLKRDNSQIILKKNFHQRISDLQPKTVMCMLPC